MDQVREALDRSEIMVLSTINRDGSPWTSPVGFRSDDDLTLHFASLMGARHVENLLRDDRVSVAIYSEPGPPGGNLGLQLQGSASLISDGGDGWQQFQVSVSEFWCFDSRIDQRRHRIEEHPG